MGPVARSPLASRLESRSLANEDAITDRYRYRYGAFIPAPAPPPPAPPSEGEGEWQGIIRVRQDLATRKPNKITSLRRRAAGVERDSPYRYPSDESIRCDVTRRGCNTVCQT